MHKDGKADVEQRLADGVLGIVSVRNWLCRGAGDVLPINFEFSTEQ